MKKNGCGQHVADPNIIDQNMGLKRDYVKTGIQKFSVKKNKII